MRKINIGGFIFEINGKIIGVITETKKNYNVSLKSRKEDKNGINKRPKK